MAAKPRRINIALVVLLGTYLIATFLVLTRPGATLSGDDRTVIRIAHWQIEEGPRGAIDKIIERYEELNPDVRVEQLAVPGGIYKQWLRTQLIGGNATDIIEFGSFWGGVNDIPPRFFDPITRYVEEPNHYNEGTVLEGVPWRDTFRDGLNNPDAFIENLSNYYAVTLCMVSMRVFYNPQLLEEINGSAVAPSSFREMRILGKNLADYNKRTGKRLTLYAGSEFTGRILLDKFLGLGGYGVSFYNDRFREQGVRLRDATLEHIRGGWSYEQPELKAALELMREAAGNMRPGYQQLDRDAAVQEFLRGETVMIVTGTWDATSLRRLAPFELEVAEFPWPDKSDGEMSRYFWGPISEGAGATAATFYLNKTSKHRKEAIDFMRFMTSLEGNGIFAQESGWLPSVREVEVPDHAKVYLPRFDGFGPRGTFMSGSEVREVWNRELHRLISENGSVDEFLGAIGQEVPEARERDLKMDLRNVYLSLRRDLPPLTALAMLDRAEGVDEYRQAARVKRESTQTLTEAKLYEAEFVMKHGDELAGPTN